LGDSISVNGTLDAFSANMRPLTRYRNMSYRHGIHQVIVQDRLRSRDASTDESWFTEAGLQG
jgi:hypothetical protein